MMQPTSEKSVSHQIQQLICQLDLLISCQLSAIMEHPRLRDLKSRWLELNYLIHEKPNSQAIKIKVLDLCWRELSRDLDRAIEFDQSLLFHMIYSQEFGLPGGEPFGLIIGAYEVSHRAPQTTSNSDIPTLLSLAQIGAAAFTPIVLTPHASLFGLDEFSELSPTLDIEQLFQAPEYIQWQQLRQQEESRFLVLTMPRMVLETPSRRPVHYSNGLHYHPRSSHTKKQHEKSGGLKILSSSQPIWGQASFGFAAVVMRAFAATGWFTQIQGTDPTNQTGGQVHLANKPVSGLNRRSHYNKIQTEVAIIDQQERELQQQGFTALTQCYPDPVIAFHSTSTLHKPKRVQQNYVNDNINVATLLPHILCAARFAHFIKVMIRDKIGRYFSANECEHYLQHWIHRYTNGNNDLDWNTQARYPLRAAQVRVKELPGKAGFYLSDIRLQPHHQIDQAISEVRLVTELAQATA